jgi:dihydrofolate reductase
MIISLIAAASENNVIGKENKLPWYLPSDLKYFKNITWAMPVVMGRKTFESMDEPLSGRTNIVVTRNENMKLNGAEVVQNVEQAIVAAKQLDAKQIFIIGGAEIFRLAISIADKIYLTRIHHNFEGDAFFPDINPDEWKLISNRDCAADNKNQYAHSFQIWERIRPVDN